MQLPALAPKYMCRHCKHKDLRLINAAIEEKYGLPVFKGDMKKCLQAIAVRLKEIKKLRAEMARNNQPTYAIDYEHDCLRFAATVLEWSRRDVKEGRRPWLNGGSLFVA